MTEVSASTPISTSFIARDPRRATAPCRWRRRRRADARPRWPCRWPRRVRSCSTSTIVPPAKSAAIWVCSPSHWLAATRAGAPAALRRTAWGRIPSVTRRRPSRRSSTSGRKDARVVERGPVLEPQAQPVALALHAGVEHVHRRLPDEGAGEEVGGPLLDDVRRARLLEHAPLHHRDAVGERARLGPVVGDEDRRQPALLDEMLDAPAQHGAQLRLGLAHRLVEQVQAGVGLERHQQDPDDRKHEEDHHERQGEPARRALDRRGMVHRAASLRGAGGALAQAQPVHRSRSCRRRSRRRRIPPGRRRAPR